MAYKDANEQDELKHANDRDHFVLTPNMVTLKHGKVNHPPQPHKNQTQEGENGIRLINLSLSNFKN